MIKCSVCGREFKRDVNKNMHEKYCKKSDKNTNEDIKKPIKKPISNNKTNTNKNEGCEHNFILLNDRIDSHRQAKKHGYSAFCSKCNELT